MSGRREIPGLYYDEERNRYFAIPASGTVAGSNSKTIQQLDKKVQEENKRKKESAQNREYISLAEQETRRRKKRQDEKYARLEKLYLRSIKFGLLHKDVDEILSREWNAIHPSRKFQMIQLKSKNYIGRDGMGRVIGMKLVTSMEGYHKGLYSIALFANGKEPHNIIFDTKVPSFLHRSIKFEDLVVPKEQPIHNLYPAGALEVVRYLNSYNGCLTYDDTNLFLIDPKYKLSNGIFCVVEKGFDSLYLGLEKPIVPKSEVTSMYMLKKTSAFGCRNGKVCIISEDQKKIKIDFGSPVCSLLLINFEGKLFCVISGINNKLESYFIDSEKGTAEPFLYYYDYNWGMRLSNNMKNDEEVPGIFCIESEVDDPNKLELLFFSVLCAKPLKMYSGPFFIKSTDKSDIEWLLHNKNLAIFCKRKQEILVYEQLMT